MTTPEDKEITFPAYPHQGRDTPASSGGDGAHDVSRNKGRVGPAGGGSSEKTGKGILEPEGNLKNEQGGEEDGDGHSGESGESSGKQGGGAGALGQMLKPPYRSGDWQLDLEGLTLNNLRHNFTLQLENLNSHPKYLKLFCTIGIRPEWDIQGLIGCLNWGCREVFTQNLDDMLISTVKEEGKKIDWRHGRIRSSTKPIFKG